MKSMIFYLRAGRFDLRVDDHAAALVVHAQQPHADLERREGRGVRALADAFDGEAELAARELVHAEVQPQRTRLREDDADVRRRGRALPRLLLGVRALLRRQQQRRREQRQRPPATAAPSSICRAPHRARGRRDGEASR